MLNLTELQKYVRFHQYVTGGGSLSKAAELKLLDIAVSAVRRNEQEKKIAAFPVADEETPEFVALVKKNLKLSNAVRVLLEDVEIGDE